MSKASGGDGGHRGKKSNYTKHGDKRDRSGRPKQYWVDEKGNQVAPKGAKGAIPQTIKPRKLYEPPQVEEIQQDTGSEGTSEGTSRKSTRRQSADSKKVKKAAKV